MTIIAKLYDGSDNFICELPDFAQVSPQSALNDVGGWNMDYPINGMNASQLEQDQDLEVWIFEDDQKIYQGLIEDDGWDQVQEETGEATVNISGRDTAGLLDFAIVFPDGGVGHKPATQVFTAKTIGFIINKFLTEAQARGAVPSITWNFTGTNDSNNAAWTQTLTMTFNAGVSVLSVLQGLAQAGYIDWRMVGHQLEIYNPGTVLASQKPDVIFRRGKNITSAPRQRTRRNLGTAFLVQGDEDTTVERTNADAIAARGRKEAFFSQGGTTDVATLNYFGDLQLAIRDLPRLSKTHNLVFPKDEDSTTPLPWLDFNVGDYVNTDLTGTQENYRVVQFSATMTSNGPISGQITLNDRFMEREVRVSQMLAGITGGGVTGVSTPTNSTPTSQTAPNLDTVAPAAPSDVVVTSDVATDAVGNPFATATVTWPAVTQNADGTANSDLDHYEVTYIYTDGSQNVAGIQHTTTTRLDYTRLPLNTNLQFQVRAVDFAGNASPWTNSAVTLMANDTAGPTLSPSTPTLDNTTYVTIIRATWDGLQSDGSDIHTVGDYDHIEVHASTAAGFAPSSATLVGTMRAAGSIAVPGNPGDTMHIAFVSVDKLGNKSPKSVEASAVVSSVQGADIAAKAVAANNLNVAIGTGNMLTNSYFFDTNHVYAQGTNGSGVNTTVDIAGTHQGDNCLHIIFPIPNSAYFGFVHRDAIPVQPNTVYSFSAWLYNPGATQFQVNVRWTTLDANQQYINEPSATSVPLAQNTWTRVTGTFTTDANASFVQLSTQFPYGSIPAFAGEYFFCHPTLTLGDVPVDATKIVAGSLAANSIVAGSAAIGTAAISDLQVGSVGVGKLTAGRLVASYIELGGRLSTAAGGVQTGARVELDGQGLRAYNSAGTQTVGINADGSASFSGNITASVITGTGIQTDTTQLNYVVIDSSGIKMTHEPTTNLVLNPSCLTNYTNGYMFGGAFLTTDTNYSGAGYPGAGSWTADPFILLDPASMGGPGTLGPNKLNAYVGGTMGGKGVVGNTSVCVFNAVTGVPTGTQGIGFATTPLQPGTTYTVSFFIYPIGDAGQTYYYNTGSIGLQEGGAAYRVVYNANGALIALPSGQWTRLTATITTLGDWYTGNNGIFYIDWLRTSNNAYAAETSGYWPKMYIDGAQVEQKYHVTDLITGALPGGTWNGTANQSTSTRAATIVTDASTGSLNGQWPTWLGEFQTNQRKAGNVRIVVGPQNPVGLAPQPIIWIDPGDDSHKSAAIAGGTDANGDGMVTITCNYTVGNGSVDALGALLSGSTYMQLSNSGGLLVQALGNTMQFNYAGGIDLLGQTQTGDNYLRLRSANTASRATIMLGRYGSNPISGYDEAIISVISGGGQYASGSNAGDLVISARTASGTAIHLVTQTNTPNVLRAATIGTAVQFGSTQNNIDVSFRPSSVLGSTNHANSAWTNVSASGFTTISASLGKHDIEPLESGWALDVIKEAPAYRWKYVPEEFAEHVNVVDDEGTHHHIRAAVQGDEWHFGPMFEDVHDDVRSELHEGLDLRDLIGVLWSAVGELSDKVRELEGANA